MKSKENELSRLVAEIRACRICAAELEPRPVLHVSTAAKILVASHQPSGWNADHRARRRKMILPKELCERCPQILRFFQRQFIGKDELRRVLHLPPVAGDGNFGGDNRSLADNQTQYAGMPNAQSDPPSI